MSRRAISGRVIGVEYHERQVNNHCALHALNNTLGEHRYTAADMTEADPQHREGNWADTSVENVLAQSEDFGCLSFDTSLPHAAFGDTVSNVAFMGFLVWLNHGHVVALRRRDPGAESTMLEWVDSLLVVKDTYDLSHAHRRLLRTDVGTVLAVYRRGAELDAVRASRRSERRQSRPSRKLCRVVDVDEE